MKQNRKLSYLKNSLMTGFLLLGVSSSYIMLVPTSYAKIYDTTVNVKGKDDFVPSSIYVAHQRNFDGGGSGQCFEVRTDDTRMDKNKDRLKSFVRKERKLFGSVNAWEEEENIKSETPYRELIETSYNLFRDYQAKRREAYQERNKMIKKQEIEMREAFQKIKRYSTSKNFPIHVNALTNAGLLQGNGNGQGQRYLASINLTRLNAEQLHSLRILVLKQYVSGAAIDEYKKINEQNPDKNIEFLFSEMKNMGLFSKEFVEWENGVLKYKYTEKLKDDEIDDENYNLTKIAKKQGLRENEYFNVYQRIPEVKESDMPFNDDICKTYITQYPESVFSKSLKTGSFHGYQIADYTKVPYNQHCEAFIKGVIAMNRKDNAFCNEIKNLKSENKTMANCKRAFKSGGISTLHENEKKLLFYISRAQDKMPIDERLIEEQKNLKNALGRKDPASKTYQDIERKIRILEGNAKDGDIKGKNDKRRTLLGDALKLRREDSEFLKLSRGTQEAQAKVRALARDVISEKDIVEGHAREEAQIQYIIEEKKIPARVKQIQIKQGADGISYGTEPLANGHYLGYDSKGFYYASGLTAAWVKCPQDQIHYQDNGDIKIGLQGKVITLTTNKTTGQFVFARPE